MPDPSSEARARRLFDDASQARGRPQVNAPPARRTRSRHGGQPLLLQCKRAPRLKREIVKMLWRVLTRFPQARTKNWAKLLKRYAVSLRPAGAPIGRFVRVVFALLAVRRPRRAVSGGPKLDRAPRLKREIVKMRWRVLTRLPPAREQRVGPRRPWGRGCSFRVTGGTARPA